MDPIAIAGGAGSNGGAPQHGRRAINLDEETVGVLEDHRAAREFERRSWAAAYRADLDLVFSRPDGIPEDLDSVTHRF